MEKPAGFQYHPNFITNDMHQHIHGILAGMDDGQWTTAGPKAKRLVIQYGYKYTYAGIPKSGLMATESIPPYIAPLVDLMREKLGLVDFTPDQVIINRYLPGEGISKHIDDQKLFGDTVVCVNIGSSATIRFRLPDTDTYYDQIVMPKSAYVMTGETRQLWTHEMLKTKKQRGTRYSITFRVIKR